MVGESRCLRGLSTICYLLRAQSNRCTRYLRHLQEQAKVSIQPQRENTLKRGHDVAFASNEKEQDTPGHQAPAILPHTAEKRNENLAPDFLSLTQDQGSRQTRYEWGSPFTLPGMTLKNDRGTPRKWSKSGLH